MEAVLDVDKKYIDKPGVKRLEIEYGDMNYIIVNLDAKVIDVDGKLWEYSISEKDAYTLKDLIFIFHELGHSFQLVSTSKIHFDYTLSMHKYNKLFLK